VLAPQLLYRLAFSSIPSSGLPDFTGCYWSVAKDLFAYCKALFGVCLGEALSP
jgi:hypothetical protein